MKVTKQYISKVIFILLYKVALTDTGSNAVLYLSVLPHFKGILSAESLVSFVWANAKPEQDDIVKTNKAGYNFHKHAGWNWNVKKKTYPSSLQEINSSLVFGFQQALCNIATWPCAE